MIVGIMRGARGRLRRVPAVYRGRSTLHGTQRLQGKQSD